MGVSIARVAVLGQNAIIDLFLEFLFVSSSAWSSWCPCALLLGYRKSGSAILEADHSSRRVFSCYFAFSYFDPDF